MWAAMERRAIIALGMMRAWVWRTRFLTVALLMIVLLALCPGAFALNPSLDASQYAHTAWRTREGFPNSQITSFAQTSDGYLWLGTDLGLLRYDGVKAVLWQSPGQALPDTFIRSLLVARDGVLWIYAYGQVFEQELAKGESIDIEPHAWLYKDTSMRMEPIVQRFTSGAFNGHASMVVNRFTGPGKVAVQSISRHKHDA